ncbi:MAG: hypothetical protein NCW75_00020 [Phycisphaera sp.]|nr:MAG: hypothetical protein NCW75_00020 [Phycisphaera sp.]
MRGIFIGVCGALVATVGGCDTGRTYAKNDLTISKTTVGESVQGRAALERPIGLPGHEVVLVPFVMEDEKGWFQSDDPYRRRGTAPAMRSRIGRGNDGWLETASRDSRSGASYAATGVRWHNAFGRDLANDERWMLLDRRGVISSVAFLTPPKSPERSVWAVMYLATTEDTNEDGLLDSLDARRAWMADGDARNPRVVTPEGMLVVRSWIDWEREYVYFQLLGDTDGDGKFSDADESAPWLLKMGDRGVARPLIDDVTMREARGLLEN